MRSPRGPWADVAAALLRLGRLGERGLAGRLLRGRVPALLAATHAHPLSPRRLLTLARETLGELLARLEPGALASRVPARGALPPHLRALLATWRRQGPSACRVG